METFIYVIFGIVVVALVVVIVTPPQSQTYVIGVVASTGA